MGRQLPGKSFNQFPGLSLGAYLLEVALENPPCPPGTPATPSGTDSLSKRWPVGTFEGWSSIGVMQDRWGAD